MNILLDTCAFLWITSDAPALRSENSIIPESDWPFDSTDALEKQLRSLLCACFPSTPVKPKSSAILSGMIKSSLLSKHAKILFQNTDNSVYLSSVSVWEIIVKNQLVQHLF